MNPDTDQLTQSITEACPSAPATEAAPAKPTKDEILDQIAVDCGQESDKYLRDSHAPKGE